MHKKKVMKWVKANVKILLACLVAVGITVAMAGPAVANCNSPVTLFEIWNTAACGTTNTTSFRLSERVLVTDIIFWSDTSIDNGRLNGTLQGPGFSLPIRTQRGNCQWSWCEEIVQIGQILPAGDYTFSAFSTSLCQNAASDGNGYIRILGCVHRRSSSANPLSTLEDRCRGRVPTKSPSDECRQYFINK